MGAVYYIVLKVITFKKNIYTKGDLEAFITLVKNLIGVFVIFIKIT